jgi:hypothetical protein
MIAFLRGGVGTVLLLAACATEGRAAPEPSPLRLSVSPSTVTAGDRATLRIELDPARRQPRPEARADLYLTWLFGPASSPFLTPQGTWSPEPIPFRQAVALAHLNPITVEWPRVAPTGRLSLALLAVEPSADPRDRSTWLFPPDLVWVRVHHATRAGDTDAVSLLMLAGLGALTAGAGIMVLRAGPRQADTLQGDRPRSDPGSPGTMMSSRRSRR